MLTLYTWTTPNGRKIPIMLEELGLPYEIKTVNLGKDEQFSPAFLAISPNNKIPALVDHGAEGGPLSIFESAAILVYLADKTGKLLPAAGPARYKVLEWLSWQIGGLGPILGQVGFFEIHSPEKSALASKRFLEESDRLLGVLDKQLSQHTYVAGDDYSIADIACYPWVAVIDDALKPALGARLAGKPHVRRWMDLLAARPAVQRGMALPKTTD
ncbi:glutathione S-transferase [Duganella sp. Leaf126]|uniref:glutathione S-transferase family protein n=1 Tax=Duganella sp. Leaf126 TaxID=1736266 RepID=UPI0006F25E41|nr:glutathione S-transferase N-terminal domain-containing protein [Duganella sp. Leaf126]KQQ33369.1 glutathione S-transferase [Duganella sp. Leaf126]